MGGHGSLLYITVAPVDCWPALLIQDYLLFFDIQQQLLLCSYSLNGNFAGSRHRATYMGQLLLVCLQSKIGHLSLNQSLIQLLSALIYNSFYFVAYLQGVFEHLAQKKEKAPEPQGLQVMVEGRVPLGTSLPLTPQKALLGVPHYL